MPELPDVVVYVESLERRIGGQRLDRVRLISPFVLRTVTPSPAAAEGRRVDAVRRLGKRIVISLDDELFLVLHLMIAGRLRWLERGKKLPARITLASFEFANGTVAFTEAGSKKRASLHVVQGESALAAFDMGGLDVTGAEPAAFRERLLRENHTLKRALTDPRLFSGIGNAYSDEILHRARLSPISLTRKLSPEEIARLHHGKFGQPCPVCGAPVQRIVYAENETNYCARCQTGGAILADRALSRLLKASWPRSIDELG